jgi:signal transduction histidine kinase
MISLYTITRFQSLRKPSMAVAATVPSLLVYVFRLPSVNGQQYVALFFVGSAIAASVALGIVVRERHAQLAALAERAAHAEFEREQRARMAVLAERARFSREMHDIVGHTLAVVIGLADGGERQAGANPKRSRQVFELIGETSRQSLADLRRTLGALRERPLDEGLEDVGGGALAPQPGVAELADLLERVRSAGPRVSYLVSGEPAALPASMQLAIYRIVQESLTNCLRHAGADTSVQVAIEAEADCLRVRVADTGSATRRAAPAHPGQAAGQGLTGVRERAALAGGLAEAGPNELGGWSVTARFPLRTTEGT